MLKHHRKTKIAGWVLLGLVGAIMILSGFGKAVLAPEALAANFERWDLAKQMRLIGAGEIVIAVLLLIPCTAGPGILLASSFFGGAIATHLANGESLLVPAGILGLAWVGFALRCGCCCSGSCCGSPSEKGSGKSCCCGSAKATPGAEPQGTGTGPIQ